MRTNKEIGQGFVYVPAGLFVYGEGQETTTKELPDFAIARYPVTYGEYAEFLDTLDDAEAKERCPHDDSGTYMEQGDDNRWRPKADRFVRMFDTVYDENGFEEEPLNRHGVGFELHLPVFAVCWHDAVAYCEWKTKTTRMQWRLPTEEEREKAARGVDGRRFAWGDLEDASLGKCSESRPEETQPEPVGVFATAESVYGMGDASGGIWEWTDSWFDERRSLRVLRGGSWNYGPESMRSLMRDRAGPTTRSVAIGFRCARDL